MLIATVPLAPCLYTLNHHFYSLYLGTQSESQIILVARYWYPNTGSHGQSVLPRTFGLRCPLAPLGPITDLLICCQLWLPVETTRWCFGSSEELLFSK